MRTWSWGYGSQETDFLCITCDLLCENALQNWRSWSQTAMQSWVYIVLSISVSWNRARPCKQCAVHCIPTDICLLYSWHSIFLLASYPTQVSMLFTWKHMVNVRHRPQHWPLSMLILVTSSHDKMKVIIKLGLSSDSLQAHAGTAAVSSVIKLNHNLGQLQSALSAKDRMRCSVQDLEIQHPVSHFQKL